MLNMLDFLGFSELMGFGPGGPKRFNMFNISPAGSIFLAFKPTKFNIAAVGVFFLIPTDVMLDFGALKFYISPARSEFCQNLLPTGEMLNLVGFGGKKVSETAEMLNMLNFLGFLELIGLSSL